VGCSTQQQLLIVERRRIDAEQKLWESGPLGRTWLRIRKRLSDDWLAG
jgi:hypothetical protein